MLFRLEIWQVQQIAWIRRLYNTV